jgi:glucose/arabinose dehydrogenase
MRKVKLKKYDKLQRVLIAITLYICGSFANGYAFEVIEFAAGFSQPLYVTSPPDDPTRLFVVEKSSGNIKIVERSTQNILTQPFISITDIDSAGEGGLLGLAFHPNYLSNGRFYIYLINSIGDSEIRSYQVSQNDLNIADTESIQTILSFSQPSRLHNGGWIGFGPDGYLYLCSGDGEGGNDPNDFGQNINTLHGKVLRIDVDGDDYPLDATKNYRIPDTNPFADKPGADEIWSYGLRNPWRCSFDRLTGDFYIADVGEGAREEVNIQLSTSIGQENYGWRLREGTIANPGDVGGPAPPMSINPAYEYSHGGGSNQGSSITGGYVYRGPILSLQGHYFFGDFIAGRIWSFKFDGSAPETHNGTNVSDFTDWTKRFNQAVSINRIASFGEDSDGNLYIVDFSDGQIFLVEAEAEDLIKSTEVPLPMWSLLLLGLLLASIYLKSQRMLNISKIDTPQ